MFFTADDRARVRAWLIDRARADDRITAAAVVGSEAAGRVDRFSDLDLTFALRDGASIDDVLADWTRDFSRAHGAAHLFDLPFLTSRYRVFLLPHNLQVDVSFTPQSDFGALGPHFQLLWGSTNERTLPPRPTARHLFGLAAHHALRARICVEREKFWQAEHWVHELRKETMTIACMRRDLETAHARGFDALPRDVLDAFTPALARSLDRGELLRALGVGIDRLLAELLAESDDASRSIARTLDAQLRALAHP
jgi:hypothetical protein